jgi:hypothetical protein
LLQHHRNRDPKQTTNVINENPETAEKLKALLTNCKNVGRSVER